MKWLLSLLLLVPARAAALQGTPNAANASREVVVGIHVNQITELSLEDNRFFIEAYMWFRWDPSEWPPIEAEAEQIGATGTARVLPYQTFEIIGSRDVSIEMNGLSPGLAVIRVRATLSQRLDANRYPLDNHVLAVAIEDIEKMPEVVLVPDTAGSAIGPDVFINGWDLGALTATRGATVYRTNFGDFYRESKAETAYSRVTFGIPVHRAGDGLFWKTYIGLLLAVAVALLSFFIPTAQLEVRASLIVGALFAAVGSQWIVGAGMPPSAEWSLSDRIHALGYGTILLSLVQTVLRAWRGAREEVMSAVALGRRDAWIALGIAGIWGMVLIAVH